ncbi:unnamed protein product [Lathyrus sativus]|nr:unnamed protein product [Lathyrus sativus]
MIMVNTQEDVLEKIATFSHSLLKNVIIISTNGKVSKVRFSQSSSSDEIMTYEGRFEILPLKGSAFVGANESEQKRVGRVKGSFISLSNSRVFGGKISNVLIAATPVQIILGSFFSEGREVVLSCPNEPHAEGPSNPPSVVHPSTGVLIS